MIFSGLLGPGAQQVVLNFGLGATDVAASARDHVLHWVNMENGKIENDEKLTNGARIPGRLFRNGWSQRHELKTIR